MLAFTFMNTPPPHTMSEMPVRLTQPRTHAISSTLLSDLAAGSSYAALHDLADAIAANDGAHAVGAHMQTLAGIGHSSGWDMLAGFISGLVGRLDFSGS